MTFRVCLAQLQADGKIGRERAERFAAEFDRLRGVYRKSMSEAAADDLATRDAMDALEWQALTDRRQKMMQIRTQQGLLEKAQAHVEGGGSAKHFAIAVMDHHEAVSGLPSVENTKGAIWRLAWSRMGDFMERYKRDMLGRVGNAPELDDVVRELRGEATGNDNAREMAAAVGDTMEWLRQQFNAAGGAIPKLKDWGLPQSHDALAVAQAGYDAWRADILPRLDWQNMIDATTNKPFPSAEALEPALEQAWRNISSEGMDNATPGAINGRGKFANRHTDHRFFVFKSADDWLAYNQRFGTGNVFDAITGHIGSMSRDIAAMRVLGPNPAATVRWLGDVLRKDALPTVALNDDVVKLGSDAGRGAKILTDLWDYYAGNMTAIAPENRSTARFFSGVRNWNVMSKLGSAALSAMPTDPMFSGMTAKFNGLPVMDTAATWLRTFNPADAGHRDAALHAGLVFAEMTGRAEQMWRDGQFNMHEFTRRGANALLETTLLTPHTVAAKQAIGLSFMKDWAENADSAFVDLAEPKRQALERYGIDAADWDRLRGTGAVEQGSVRLLRPADLARSDVAGGLDSAVKFMSLIDSETKFGVPGESLRAQAAVATMGHSTRIERGTIGGELLHSATQFKTYSVVWMMTHLERALYGRGGISRMQYALTLPIFLTIGGYIADSLIDLSRGETPSPDLTPLRLGRAMVRGGGLGILGDIASQSMAGQQGRTTGGVTGFLVGPTLGAVADPIAALTLGNIGEASSGKDMHLGSELVRQARQAVPGSNAWYARVAMNRLVMDQLQTLADPNYRQSFQRIERAAAERGSGYWWAPGQTAPDFSGANPAAPQQQETMQ
ncbi:hypothetical protein [Novosphingobium sp. FKTRR1]|uniref:hypothetical protein n=1 Tax=Novosphingobium sp. FKTRR1 TaxID=2879118 RepID=UPI001CF01DA9|nr:hypothetical protein [Novosphingobium sp. FKTRR1]